LHVGLCESVPCATWVMPAGKAWTQGVRPGMTVLSADGQSLAERYSSPFTLEPVREALLLGPSGEAVHVEVTENPISQSPLKFSGLAT
jgi:hypothetical protein